MRATTRSRPRLAELEARRAYLCRLTPDRALGTIDEAAAFLNDRGMLTLTPDSALPSLFGACHEEPYKPGSHGFGLWPKTKYPWAFELARHAGGYRVALHRGKTLYVSREVAAIVDPLCRAELEAATGGRYGREAARLVAHLEDAGPSLVEDLKLELGLDAKRLRVVREPLERVGALVSRGEEIPLPDGGHQHASRLYRWDQYFRGGRRRVREPLASLVVAGVRAAVLAREREVATWFSWTVSRETVDDLVERALLTRPAPGWLATP